MAGEGRGKEIDRLTMDGLAEGYRLASEARDVIMSRYQDMMIAVVILCMFLWVFLLFAFAIVLSGQLGAGPEPLEAASIVIAFVAVPLLFVTKRYFDRRLAEQDRWIDRLRYPVAPGKEDTASTFDLLVEVSQQVPAWLEIKKKDRFRNHPFLNTAIFIGTASSVYVAWTAYQYRDSSSFGYLMAMLAAFTALSIASTWAESAAIRRERDSTLARWKDRMEASRHAMEEILGGL